MQLFSTPVTSSNLRNQASLFTELCLVQATHLSVLEQNTKSHYIVSAAIPGTIMVCIITKYNVAVDCIALNYWGKHKWKLALSDFN